MSQDNQKRNDGQRDQNEDITRQGRGTGSDAEQQNPGSASRPDQAQDVEDADDLDEDRDDDQRSEGGTNRRSNIG